MGKQLSAFRRTLRVVREGVLPIFFMDFLQSTAMIWYKLTEPHGHDTEFLFIFQCKPKFSCEIKERKKSRKKTTHKKCSVDRMNKYNPFSVFVPLKWRNLVWNFKKTRRMVNHWFCRKNVEFIMFKWIAKERDLIVFCWMQWLHYTGSFSTIQSTEKFYCFIELIRRISYADLVDA